MSSQSKRGDVMEGYRAHWWRLIKRDGSSLWMPEDPSDRLTAAWEGATVEEYVPAGDLRGAVEALRFYADESNWTARNPPGSGAPAWHDHGQRARDALGGR